MKTKATKSDLNVPLKMAIISSRRRQIDIAARAAINEVRLSKIVTGREIATDEEKRAIAKVLGVGVADVFPVVAGAQ